MRMTQQYKPYIAHITKRIVKIRITTKKKGMTIQEKIVI
jgi:hypothetical protein